MLYVKHPIQDILWSQTHKICKAFSLFTQHVLELDESDVQFFGALLRFPPALARAECRAERPAALVGSHWPSCCKAGQAQRHVET